MTTISKPREGTFEFTEAENVEFRVAAFWMGNIGRLGVLIGVLTSLNVLVGSIPCLIGGMVTIIASIWTIRAGSAFARVADTTGRDLENVMVAVVSLKKLYRLQAILIGIAFGLILLVIWMNFGHQPAY